MTGYDVVVVGAGSAGCVLAARLAKAGREVLLLEAGPDYKSDMSVPSEIADARMPALTHDWGFGSVPGRIVKRRPPWVGTAAQGSIDRTMKAQTLTRSRAPPLGQRGRK